MMKILRAAVGWSFAILCLIALASCAGDRAMSGYYRNHPEMQKRLIEVRSIYVEGVRGAENDEESMKMRRCLIEELQRKGRGRFRLARRRSEADAVLQADMKEELGPTTIETPLPFELEAKITITDRVYLRMKLVDPHYKRLIYKTDT
ncbi:MAG: hypothetical protein P8123_02020, partial [bacterium]